MSVRKSGDIVGVLLDLTTLNPTGITIFSDKWGREVPTLHEFLAASADGRTFTNWREGRTTKWVDSYVRRGEQYVGYVRDESRGPVTPSADGSLVYTLGDVYAARESTDEIKARGQDHGGRAEQLFLPAATGTFRLGWSAKSGAPPDVSLYAQHDSVPILTIPGLQPPVITPKFEDEDPLFSRRLLYLPNADMVMSLGPELDTVILHRFSLAEELAKLKGYLYVTSTPPPVAVPSTRWNYPIVVKSSRGDVKYKLVKGPPGATMLPSGTLTWLVGKAPNGNQEFVVEIAPASGLPTTHSFQVMVDAKEILP